MPDFFSDTTTRVLAKCLDGVGIRQRVIADNIANVETPGFKRSEVRFEDRLREALESDSEASFSKRLHNLQPEIEQDLMSPCRADGNNVSIDREMADLTKNSLQYETLIQLMNLKGSMLRTAISEGKR